MRLIVALVLIALGSGCSTYKNSRSDHLYFTPEGLWSDTEAGELKGKLNLQWCGPDIFLYVPHETDPLTFIRKKNGEVIDVIIPNQKFYTDGGSIPRPGWLMKDFSPWNFAPAYMIHDWLFEINHCGLDNAAAYNHIIAAQIMAEVIKTQLLKQNCGDPDQVSVQDKAAMHTIYQTVVGFSKELWEPGPGRCDLYDSDEAAE